MPETLAYPYAALCFLLIAKALVTRRRWWIVGAIAATLVAPLIRGELVVVPIILLLSTLFALWSSERARERRKTWSSGDYIGVFTLVAGIVIAVSGFASWHSDQWLQVTAYNWTKHRIFIYGDWAAGALAIGLGVIPLVAGLAGLVPVRGEKRTRELRMIRCVGLAGLIAFGLYTAMKAAYLSMNFETRVEERNLIYIAPLLFIGTALVLERRRVNLVALGLAAAYGFYLIVGTPYFIDRQLYSDALGLAILEQGNRFFELTPSAAQWLLLALLAVGLALVLALTFLRGRRTLEHGARRRPRSRPPRVERHRPDSRRGRKRVGQPRARTDPSASVHVGRRRHRRKEDALPGAGCPRPEPGMAARVLEPLDRHRQQPRRDPGRAGPGRGAEHHADGHALLDPRPGTCRAHVRLRGRGLALCRLRRHVSEEPLLPRRRERAGAVAPDPAHEAEQAARGVHGDLPDGWSGAADSSYLRFSTKGQGWLRIKISRENWPASPVHVRLSSIRNFHHQLVPGNLLREVPLTVKSQGTRVLWLRTPAKPFFAQVIVDRKFIPRNVDPRSGDPRLLGAQVSYRFFTKRPGTPHTGS